MHVVYYLADPREPHIIKYIGRTSVSTADRLSNHISEAKYRKNRKPNRMAKRHIWIIGLLEEGIKPIIIKLWEFATLEQCIEAEASLLILTKGTVLNHPILGWATTGKPLGKKDTEQARLNKRLHWRAAEIDMSSRSEDFESAQLRRSELKFPFPQYGYKHPANLKHYRDLQAQVYRKKVGYPRPDLPSRSPENWAHYLWMRTPEALRKPKGE